MAFHFTIEHPDDDGGPISVRLSGRMTLGPHLLDFSRRTADLLASHRAPGVFLDVSGVDDLDSAGLGELVILYTTAGQNKCRLCLLDPTPRIVKLLETTKLSGILPHFRTVAAANAWLAE